MNSNLSYLGDFVDKLCLEKPRNVEEDGADDSREQVLEQPVSGCVGIGHGLLIAQGIVYCHISGKVVSTYVRRLPEVRPKFCFVNANL